ncbi:MAG: 23S rRNA (guanosine(2251)-2'-O)-methyltransferase RlmB [Legionellaceae bacterium]|nr:23S rRNA (guanosine(2251)-2'-O)-methyltransferase RlmB [Legionellaceae bacterium]
MNNVLIYGIHAVESLLKKGQRKVLRVCVASQDRRLQSIITLAKKQNVPLEVCPLSTIQEKLGEVVHQGVYALAEANTLLGEADIPLLLDNATSPALILVLDGVTDPHNLGACLRVADACNVDFVLIPKDKSASITPTVSKVACGAAETVPVVQATNLVRALEILKANGVWIHGAAGEATSSLYALDSTGPVALVLGSEGHGLRQLTRKHCDTLFSIPMLGSVSSLNVSVAAGITLYETIRQRKMIPDAL